jgi:hypothetical protein
VKRPEYDPNDPLLHSAFTPVRRDYPKNVTLPKGLTWHKLPDLHYADRMPRRLITRSGARVRGIFNHSRVGRCEWESGPESCLYPLLAMTKSVRRVYSQPVVIRLNAGEYTPDALVFLANGKRRWIECKQSSDVDEEARAKMAEAALTFLNAGDSFVIVDETYLKDELPAVINARHFSAWYEETADFVPLVKEPRPYAELIGLYGAHAINRAVARGELMLDFNVEYSPQTLMWTPKQGEGYEPDFIRN